jgi:hypothetical protein
MARIITTLCDICEKEIPAGFPARPNYAAIDGGGTLPINVPTVKRDMTRTPNRLEFQLLRQYDKVKEIDICYACMLDIIQTAPAHKKLKEANNAINKI